MKTFFKWLLVFLASITGAVLAHTQGFFGFVLKYDFSYISFVIFGCYFVMSVGNGLTSLTSRDPQIPTRYLNKVKKRLDVSNFVSESVVGLGLLGTVVGLIYMVFDSLGSEAASNIQKTIESLKLGLATALITTGVGLICGLFLNIQSYIISYDLEKE